MNDDDHLLSEIGLEFGEGVQNRFVLTEYEPEENDQAICVVRNNCFSGHSIVHTLTVNKCETAGELYKRVLQMCQSDNSTISIDSFDLTFNSYVMNDDIGKGLDCMKMHKVCKIVSSIYTYNFEIIFFKNSLICLAENNRR